jgi:hypothetical protein
MQLNFTKASQKAKLENIVQNKGRTTYRLQTPNDKRLRNVIQGDTVTLGGRTLGVWATATVLTVVRDEAGTSLTLQVM